MVTQKWCARKEQSLVFDQFKAFFFFKKKLFSFMRA